MPELQEDHHQPAHARLRAEVRLQAAQEGPREAAAAKQPGKRRRDSHDYTECSDNDCPRSLCVAYKTGWKAGDEAGYDRGWQQGHEAGFKEGYDKGFPDGIAACPRPHK